MSNAMKAAIVGYWRCGNTFKQIGELLGINEVSIQAVVEYYLEHKRHN